MNKGHTSWSSEECYTNSLMRLGTWNASSTTLEVTLDYPSLSASSNLTDMKHGNVSSHLTQFPPSHLLPVLPVGHTQMEARE